MIRRARRLLVSRFVAGDLRRWALYGAATFGARQVRKLFRTQPEVVYRAKLQRGQVLGTAVSGPLPRALRTKRVRKALEAASRADLAAGGQSR